MNNKNELVLRKAAEAIKARGHDGDARLANSVLGVIESLKAAAPTIRDAPKDCGACGDGCPGKACRLESESPTAAAAPTILGNNEFLRLAMAYRAAPNAGAADAGQALADCIDATITAARQKERDEAEDAAAELQITINNLRARLASAGAGSDGIDYRMMSEQAEAWRFVFETLQEVAPGWLDHPSTTGMGKASAAIRKLAELARTTNKENGNG